MRCVVNAARTIRRGITVMAVAALCALIALPAYAAYEDSLEGYWKMDNAWVDSTSNSNTGTGVNGVTFNASGKFSQAGNFDGNNDYVNIADSSSLDGMSQGLTLSAWIKPGNVAASSKIFMKGDAGGNPIQDQYQLYVENKDIKFVVGNDTTSSWTVWYAATANNAIPVNNEWYHVVATWNGIDDVFSIYVNNNLVVSGASAPGGKVSSAGSAPLAIGRAGTYNSYYFNGLIDDTAIWSRSLDANEISMIYDLGTEKFEWLTLGVNDTDNLNLGYTTSELKLLADLYVEQNTGLSETIDGLTWHYLSGDLPGDIGGTTYDYGDTWTYDGKYYLKLGSGLEGSIPEPGCAFGILLGFFVPGLRRVLKRKVLGARGKGQGSRQ